MEIRAAGIDLNDSSVRGQLDLLAAQLDYYQSCGFQLVELTTAGLCFLFGGRLDRLRAEEICRLLRRFPFRYTLHLPDRLNLAASPFPERERAVFQACLEFAGLAGAEVVVYHSGQSFLDTAAREREGSRRRETEALAELAAAARPAGILVAVENCNPEPGEPAQISERAMSARELREAYPALYLGAVAEQVQEIGADNLGITLDPGHLFLASRLTGEDFLGSVARHSRLIRHLHLNDNFGRNPSGRYSRLEEVLYGEADCHLPPGMGAIPLGEVLRRLPEFKGYVVFEIRPAYRDLLPRCLSWLRGQIAWE